MKKLIHKLFSSKSKPSAQQDVDALRNDFKHRYQQFKQLLSANNKALALMGDLERAMTGAFAFDMAFVQSRCTQISINVFQIVKLMNLLSDDRYAVLYERFKAIQHQLNPHVHPRTALPEGPMVVALEDIEDEMVDQVGLKMASISKIATHLDVKVPKGFVVTTNGFHRFMTHRDLQTEINRRIQATDIRKENDRYELSMDLQQLIIQADLPPELELAIMDHYAQLVELHGPDLTLAVRSSALGEDLKGATFAGQFRSILNVDKEHLLQSYKEVVASKYSPAAMTYRLRQGIPDQENAMCVGVMTMVDAAAGGVVYTRNPLDIREDRIYVHAAWGLPKSVVDGTIDTDLYIVGRQSSLSLVDKEIAFKETQYVCYPQEGVCRLELVEGQRASACLSDDQAVEIARHALAIETYFGEAQDIEWAVKADGTVVVLQSRPLQETTTERSGRNAIYQRQSVQDKQEGDTVVLEDGVTASPGAACGPVFILTKESDLLRFPDDAVLVVRQALPRWAIVMGRAAAVIAETGSIAGHLANVAREYAVPALFKLPGAIDVLKNDVVVTVDADGRKVYAGCQQHIIADTVSPKTLMDQTPVFDHLKAAADLILPLNLIDPDSTEFRASSCRTMHDITRFCHENAVREVFRFGKEHHFNERSSKQLRDRVPLQWWVLNLDDGFKREVSGKYVDLADIVSIPMLALWEGIVALPWQGPPAVDGRGLMSVMFQATANRNLLPTVRSSYANRNYFMISKYFCNLQSRLGFHFAQVEALVSERTIENYIVFHFKGGATDFARRVMRLQMIAEILEAYDFSVRLHQDALRARIEGLEMLEMKKHLRVLGYLNIHTRQLDMIMQNPEVALRYKKKMLMDLSAMTA